MGRCHICGKEIDSYHMFCQEHVLQKEARYALWDLDPEKQWGPNDDVQYFKDWGVKRLIALAEYYIDRDWNIPDYGMPEINHKTAPKRKIG